MRTAAPGAAAHGTARPLLPASRLTLARADRIRRTPGRSALLYLTDRCPVGCDHCSVSASVRPERPVDAARLERIVDALCARGQLRLVGVSGGEPFVERRLLESVTARLAESGKQVLLYTSGYWGRDDGTVPRWTRAVLERADCLVLSTDGHHAARLPAARYVAAMRAAAEAGAWIAVQALDTPAQLEAAERLLRRALGARWSDRAELRPTPLLLRGRALDLLGARPAELPGSGFGACPLAASPVARHDGRVTACCNEDVVTGGGPAPLHRSAGPADGSPDGPVDDAEVLDLLERDAFLAVARTAGLGALTRLPGYAELGERRYRDICGLCWALLDAGAHEDPRVLALGRVLEPPPGPDRSPRPSAGRCPQRPTLRARAAEPQVSQPAGAPEHGRGSAVAS